MNVLFVLQLATNVLRLCVRGLTGSGYFARGRIGAVSGSFDFFLLILFSVYDKL